MEFIHDKTSWGTGKIVDKYIKPERPIVFIIMTLPFRDNALLDHAVTRFSSLSTRLQNEE